MKTNSSSRHTRNKRLNSRVVISNIIGISIVVIAVAAALNVQKIVDYTTYITFKPSTTVKAIGDRSGMSHWGEVLFYASKPVIQEAKDFNANCRSVEDSTSILGCYTKNKIFLYNIKNKELDGIHEVTAMHEMLHAAYERTSEVDKQRLEQLLEKEYKKLSNDKSLAERMKIYAKLEPGQRHNELHSIIGTEVKKLSPELEQHYSHFFSNRQKVVSLYDKYSSVFKKLELEAEKLVAKLTALEKNINNQKAAYDRNITQLNSAIDSFNQRADSGYFSSNAEFNQERSGLLYRSNILENQRQGINRDVETYQKLADELKKISVRSEELDKSINSTIEPSTNSL